MPFGYVVVLGEYAKSEGGFYPIYAGHTPRLSLDAVARSMYPTMTPSELILLTLELDLIRHVWDTLYNVYTCVYQILRRKERKIHKCDGLISRDSE